MANGGSSMEATAPEALTSKRLHDVGEFERMVAANANNM